MHVSVRPPGARRVLYVAPRHEPSGRSARGSRAAVPHWALDGPPSDGGACLAQALGVSWKSRQPLYLAEGRLESMIPARCEGVRVLARGWYTCGATPYGDKYVTVMLGRPLRTRPSRSLQLPGQVPGGRSKPGFQNLAGLPRPDTWREALEIVAMDGFTGFAAAEPPARGSRGPPCAGWRAAG